MDRLHEPESEAVGLIEGEIALDPRRRFVSRLGAWVEAHLILVGDHCGKGAEVGFLELAQSRPGGLENRRHRFPFSLTGHRQEGDELR